MRIRYFLSVYSDTNEYIYQELPGIIASTRNTMIGADKATMFVKVFITESDSDNDDVQ